MSEYLIYAANYMNFPIEGQEQNFEKLTIEFFEQSIINSDNSEQMGLMAIESRNMIGDIELDNLPTLPGFYDINISMVRGAQRKAIPKISSVKFLREASLLKFYDPSYQGKSIYLVLYAKKYSFMDKTSKTPKRISGIHLRYINPSAENEGMGYPSMITTSPNQLLWNKLQGPGYYELLFENLDSSKGMQSILKDINFIKSMFEPAAGVAA